MPRESGEKLITVNRKARHDYFIDETVEAGIMLLGAEVKSLRDGKVNLKDSYAKITKGGEAYLVGVHITPYGYAARDVPDPDRQRKLLLHRREIDRLAGKTRERGFTLIPTKLYFKNGVAKVEIGLARGKEHHDKRQDLKAAESKREIDRVMKSRNRTRS
ncbi:SsrA-binding protein SmpB [Candidatus Binatia bacterium]|jgi:SsrA-binding protein|nr:SsrA-binding protein SmpB [Candidatus Binatia bacterium]